MKKNWIANKFINQEKVNKYIEICLKNNQFTNGGIFVNKLETFIKNNFKIEDSKSIICVANATLGLWALSSAIELHNNINIKWTTQSFTFPPSAQGLLKDSYIVDIDEEGGLDLNLVPEDSNGIIITNIFGNVVNIDKYIEYADKFNKFLIFDNAATPYTFYKGKNSCNYGIGSVISFHHTKPFGFAEGGAVIIDKIYENTIRRLINFGIDNINIKPWNRLGGNYKMSEISAIYILQYLEDNFYKIIDHHNKLYLNYYDKFNMYPNFGDKDKTVISCFCLLNKKYTNEFINKLINKGIMCRKYYDPLVKTKIAMEIYNQILCYPCNLDIKSIDL